MAEGAGAIPLLSRGQGDRQRPGPPGLWPQLPHLHHPVGRGLQSQLCDLSNCLGIRPGDGRDGQQSTGDKCMYLLPAFLLWPCKASFREIRPVLKELKHGPHAPCAPCAEGLCLD